MTEPPPDLTLYAIPAFFALMAIELAVLRHRQVGVDRRDYVASLGVGLGSLITINLVMAAVGWWWATVLWGHRVTDLGTGWVAWMVALVGWDLIYYWDHRISHEVRFFWASHVNHHSSEAFNLSTALRQPWTAFQTPLLVAFLALVGVRPALIVMAGAINLLYQFWIHTEIVGSLGPLERVLNSPSHHRVHHGSNARFLDRNYGGILIVWDRLFGTFQIEDEPVTYGLTKNIRTYNIWTIVWHEYRAMARDVVRAGTWSERLGRMFRGPGWEPVPAGGGPAALEVSRSRSTSTS